MFVESIADGSISWMFKISETVERNFAKIDINFDYAQFENGSVDVSVKFDNLITKTFAKSKLETKSVVFSRVALLS